MDRVDELGREEVLRVLLGVLRGEHAQLEVAIAEIEAGLHIDQLQLRRLKKRKLLLKDNITRIENNLLPDIIA